MSSTNINYTGNSGSGSQNNISSGSSGSGSGSSIKRKRSLKILSSGSSGDGSSGTKKKRKTTKKKKKTRSPRSSWEISNLPSASTMCVRCAETHTHCTFDTDSQQCTACKHDGCECQPLNTSWKHNNKNSKLGQRGRCVCCSNSSKQCIYVDMKDKYNYDTCCIRCKRNNVPCWPDVSYRGMKSSKIFSGVENNFISKHGLDDLVSDIVFSAAANFLATVDFPMNFDNGYVSTQRKARCRTNYGDINEEITYRGHTYYKMYSYGSGTGASSVGTTPK